MRVWPFYDVEKLEVARTDHFKENGASLEHTKIRRNNPPSAEWKALRAGSVPSAYALGYSYGRDEPGDLRYLRFAQEA